MYTVPDLRPAMQYQFKVAAVNEVGQGSFSSPSDVIELPQQRKFAQNRVFTMSIPNDVVRKMTHKTIN